MQAISLAASTQILVPLPLHSSPLLQHSSPLLQHSSPLLQHLSPLLQHLSPLLQHLAPLLQHLAPLPQHLAPFPQHLPPLPLDLPPLPLPAIGAPLEGASYFVELPLPKGNFPHHKDPGTPFLLGGLTIFVMRGAPLLQGLPHPVRFPCGATKFGTLFRKFPLHPQKVVRPPSPRDDHGLRL